MDFSLSPRDPSAVTAIREIVPNVITTLSAPFSRFGLIRIGSRGTIGEEYFSSLPLDFFLRSSTVRLKSGAVAVFSPTPLTPEAKEIVTKLGEHHIFLGPWHQEFPQAKLIGPEGLPEKREKQNNDQVPFSVVFTDAGKDCIAVDAEFDIEFDYVYISSHPNKELIFHHKPSRTLIEADLFFNLPANEQYSKAGVSPTSGLLTRLFGLVSNLQGDCIWQKRLIYQTISAAGRPEFNRAIANISKWDFDRIIPCHGDVIESGGKETFCKLFGWHLTIAKETLPVSVR
ncbi:hypothetical protein BFJ69_g7857 [Fusarium oxysporum]|uniref:DUF4336 domain-containing protein n=1 Tax=Fusarium oxysporum TaxID=5507 RepID=A0A420N4M5_FUSOX|nr:hypothetical protein BFJ69_g7857 [Fusarium oxysporum]